MQTMKSIKATLLFSAVGVALLATPAFAQQPPRHHMQPQVQYQDPSGTPVVRGSNADPQYVPGYGNTGGLGFNEW
jgi:hypothetical protein